MHLEAVIVRSWRLYSTEFGDILGGCEQEDLEMHLKAGFE
jgi:hypothetical protein